MAGFLEGFATSLKGQIDANLADRRALRLEDSLLDLRVRREKELVAAFEIDLDAGTATPVNATGEVVGPPRPATKFELDKKRRESKSFEREDKKADAEARSAELQAAAETVTLDPETIQERIRREAEQSDADIAARNAQAEESRANTRRNNIITEQLRSPAPNTREGAVDSFERLNPLAVGIVAQGRGGGLSPAQEEIAKAVATAQANAAAALSSADPSAIIEANETLQAAINVAISRGLLPASAPQGVASSQDVLL